MKREPRLVFAANIATIAAITLYSYADISVTAIRASGAERDTLR